MTKYCLDTYAIIEIMENNPSYHYLLNENCVIPELTLAELFSVILRKTTEKEATKLVQQFESLKQHTSVKTLCNAMKYKKERKKDNVSFFDAIGYMHAQENKQTFVTSDKEFAKEQNVLFLK